MKKEFIITRDGSSSIFLPHLNETYHSKNGAIQEAYHVFIKNGLDNFDSEISILEIGFGTGLNAFITFLESEKKQQKINYIGIEAYPILMEELQHLNYIPQLKADDFASKFQEIHQCDWEKKHEISPNFFLTKKKLFFEDISEKEKHQLIYFDAFGYDVQPELWSEKIFQKMYDALVPNGILVTYACRRPIKDALQTTGFSYEKLPGAPGKREMLRAFKM